MFADLASDKIVETCSMSELISNSYWTLSLAGDQLPTEGHTWYTPLGVGGKDFTPMSEIATAVCQDQSFIHTLFVLNIALPASLIDRHVDWAIFQTIREGWGGGE